MSIPANNPPSTRPNIPTANPSSSGIAAAAIGHGSNPAALSDALDATRFAELSVENASVATQSTAWQRVRKNMSVKIGGIALLILVLISLLAPWMGTVDPSLFDPSSRDLLPGKPGEITTLEGETIKHTFVMGSDSFGRDIYSRVIYGTRISLIVGLSTAIVALSFGILFGLCAGFLRWLDGPLMRVMDGIMAIPAILIAIALVAMWRGSLMTVVIAIAIPEIPRVTRLVRSLVLSIREEPYVEAAISLGTSTPKIMWRHILPNCVAPLVVQGTFICASGILVEAILSFLGVGLPPDIPTWGSVMAEGRAQFNEYPHNIFFPGIFLAVTVLAVNILGDGLRDTLDPKMAKRV
jgi:peptide/nickel transport system permease protein